MLLKHWTLSYVKGYDEGIGRPEARWAPIPTPHTQASHATRRRVWQHAACPPPPWPDATREPSVRSTPHDDNNAEMGDHRTRRCQSQAGDGGQALAEAGRNPPRGGGGVAELPGAVDHRRRDGWLL